MPFVCCSLMPGLNLIQVNSQADNVYSVENSASEIMPDQWYTSSVSFSSDGCSRRGLIKLCFALHWLQLVFFFTVRKFFFYKSHHYLPSWPFPSLNPIHTVVLKMSPVLSWCMFFTMDRRTDVCSLLNFCCLQNSTMFVYRSSRMPRCGSGASLRCRAWHKILDRAKSTYTSISRNIMTTYLMFCWCPFCCQNPIRHELH